MSSNWSDCSYGKNLKTLWNQPIKIEYLNFIFLFYFELPFEYYYKLRKWSSISRGYLSIIFISNNNEFVQRSRDILKICNCNWYWIFRCKNAFILHCINGHKLVVLFQWWYKCKFEFNNKKKNNFIVELLWQYCFNHKYINNKKSWTSPIEQSVFVAYNYCWSSHIVALFL